MINFYSLILMIQEFMNTISLFKKSVLDKATVSLYLPLPKTCCSPQRYGLDASNLFYLYT